MTRDTSLKLLKFEARHVCDLIAKEEAVVLDLVPALNRRRYGEREREREILSCLPSPV